jgi:hypothetical protein
LLDYDFDQVVALALAVEAALFANSCQVQLILHPMLSAILEEFQELLALAAVAAVLAFVLVVLVLESLSSSSSSQALSHS